MCPHLELIASKKNGTCCGINSWAAHRNADDANTDGLYSTSLISAIKHEINVLLNKKIKIEIINYCYYSRD